jgi:hypothetical protein
MLLHLHVNGGIPSPTTLKSHPHLLLDCAGHKMYCFTPLCYKLTVMVRIPICRTWAPPKIEMVVVKAWLTWLYCPSVLWIIFFFFYRREIQMHLDVLYVQKSWVQLRFSNSRSFYAEKRRCWKFQFWKCRLSRVKIIGKCCNLVVLGLVARANNQLHQTCAVLPAAPNVVRNQRVSNYWYQDVLLDPNFTVSYKICTFCHIRQPRMTANVLSL